MVNYHSTVDIARQLASGALDDGFVVLVDNDSDPQEITRLASAHDALAVLNDDNVGFAAGVNAGVRKLREHGYAGPVLLLNPDTEVEAAQLRELLDVRERGGFDAVAPLMVLPDGTLQVGVAGSSVTLWRIMIYFCLLSHVLPALRGTFWTRRRGGEAAWLCGGCLLTDTAALERFGPWPEDEIVYAEDVSWGSQATERGARFLLASDIRVLHRGGASGGSAAWSGALERLCRRRLGRLQGSLAGCAIRLGIMGRRAVGRRIA